jgi:outer membrane receptor protein involved in Fe transport
MRTIHHLLSATALAGALLTPGIAFAQDDTAAQSEAPADDSDAVITVTGSRIARPAADSPVPVTSISAAELTSTGRVAIGDQLNDLPSLRTTFGQQQNTTGLGVSGLNLLDLRGLGTVRTLVLVNGRRHVGADILVNGVSVDVNTIPTELIDRVDIVTGGNSAVYGSDAIAGVVNFVMKRNFEGVLLRGQSGISDEGDAGTYRVSLTAGTDFADGRGNIAVNGEYSYQTPFYASQRREIAENPVFVQVDTDPAGTPNGSDGVPDRRLFNNIRSATLSPGGTTNFGSRQCGQDATGAFFDCTFLFQRDGSLISQTGQRVGLGPNGNFVGGNGSTNREGQLLGLLSRNERMVGNLFAHYEFSPAAELFAEAKFAHSNTLSTGSGPAFFQGATLGVFGAGTRERPRLDNPYLTTQARNLIISQITAANAFLAPANQTVISGAIQFNLRVNLVDLGSRMEEARRDTWRVVGGLRGTFNDDWQYEISANYGKFKESTKVLGNVNLQRLLLAMDATTNPQGQIVCRATIYPAARIALQGNPAATARLAGDVAACVPVNFFGQGNVTQAARNYIVQDTVSRGSISQFVGMGYVAGDTSGFFNLPGGPVRFVLGAEYRRETNTFREDDLVHDGVTFYNSIAPFVSSPFTVKEAYGELQVPLLKDVPFFEQLELGAAGRISSYGGAVGTTKTYNLNGLWSPIRGVKFRGGYARALRAPNLGELYTQQGQNFAPGFQDPCSARNIGAGTATRAANCAADGAPAGYDFVYIASLGFKSGGNPNLREETSKSLTLGGVVEPGFIPGLSIAADYYDITVNNVILTLGAQTIANLCYDSPNLNNPFCGQFQRNKTGATLASGEIPFQIREGSLLSSGVNFAKLKVRGIDFDVAYRKRFGFGSVGAHLVWTRALQSDQFTDPTRPTFANRILGEAGDPKNAFNLNVDVATGPVQIGYQLRYIGPMNIQGNAIESTTSVQGRPPQDADYAEPLKYPSTFYHNLRVGVDVGPKYNFYLGVENLLDTKVPFNQTGSGGTTTGAATRIYDSRGRFLYAGFSAKF